jgi:hypothetical protein
MKTLVKIVAVLSLAACLAAAALYFLGRTTQHAYFTWFAVFSVVYFVSATLWSEARR